MFASENLCFLLLTAFLLLIIEHMQNNTGNSTIKLIFNGSIKLYFTKWPNRSVSLILDLIVQNNIDLIVFRKKILVHFLLVAPSGRFLEENFHSQNTPL
jgi:hypothetical protein